MREVSVEVPQGVSDGTRLRINREGEAGSRGNPPGDLYVEISVRPHDLFARQGDDLVYRLQVGVAQAALGAEVDVPLLDGQSTKVEIEPGTQPADVLRLRGEGVGRLGRRGRGDLFVRIEVEVPHSLSPAERELLRGYAEVRGGDT